MMVYSFHCNFSGFFLGSNGFPSLSSGTTEPLRLAHLLFNCRLEIVPSAWSVGISNPKLPLSKVPIGRYMSSETNDSWSPFRTYAPRRLRSGKYFVRAAFRS